MLLLLLFFFLGGRDSLLILHSLLSCKFWRSIYASHDLEIRASALFCGVDVAPEQKSEGREEGRKEGRKVTGDPCSSSRRPQPAI